jgi:hypothetical protein
MFCKHCGTGFSNDAKFCEGCGSQVSNSSNKSKDLIKESAEISPAEILNQSLDLIEVFENETWVVELIKKKWPKSNPGNYNQKVIGRFKGKLANPTGSDLEVIFTDEYLGLVSKGSPMGWPIPSMVVIHTRDKIKLIQVGSANYIHTSGAGSRNSDWWTVSIILENDRELPIIYLPLGETNFQQQKNSELYSAKISILAPFFPMSLDGGHIEKAGGYSIGFGVGFWNSID